MKTSSPLCTILSQGCSLPSKVTVMVNLVFVTHAYLNSYFCILGRRQCNGTPLQCSFLENPRDGRAWWAAVYGVVQSRT